mgnify:CR=1 FL=1
MALGLLTLTNFQKRTKVKAIRETQDRDLVQYWIDLAESLLESIELDSSVAGYTFNMAFVVQKIAENLFLRNEEQVVIAANNLFQSERLGSYSYKKLPISVNPDIFDQFEPIVKAIVSKYSKQALFSSVTTPVFTETIADHKGIREYHDYLRIVTEDNRNLFGMADIVTIGNSA